MLAALLASCSPSDSQVRRAVADAMAVQLARASRGEAGLRHPAEVVQDKRDGGAGSDALPYHVLGFDDGSQVMIIGYYNQPASVLVMVREAPGADWRTIK